MNIFQLLNFKKEKVETKKQQGEIKQRKEKSQTYILRKNMFMKIMRIILWVILIFVFIRGLISIIRPDSYTTAINTIKEFKNDFKQIKNSEEELFAFSQNFIYEYTTYEVKKEADYIQRVKQYAIESLFNKEIKFLKSAKCLYARAYRLEEYAENRYNMYVVAKIEYTEKKATENNATFIDVKTVQDRTFKVPVFKNKGSYLIDNLPALTNDTIKLQKHNPQQFLGKELLKSETDRVRKSLGNFFKSYYEEEQNIIDYYLSADADKNKFQGLNKQVLYKEITNLRVYELDESKYLALVSLLVIDNETLLQQDFNIILVSKDSRYYIEDIDTRITNLKYQNEKE